MSRPCSAWPTASSSRRTPDGALAKLRDAAKANPAMLTPEAVMAQFCQRSGDVANAKKWMAAALAAAPKNLKTRLAVGQCALEMGLMDEAQKHAIAAMQIDPKSLEAEFFRGLVALCQKDYHTAESYFESALQAAPPGSAFPISNNLALALIEQEDEAKQPPRLGVCRSQCQAVSQVGRRQFDLRLGALPAGSAGRCGKRPSCRRRAPDR